MKNTNQNHQNIINSSDKLSSDHHKGVKPIHKIESGQKLSTGEHTPVLPEAVLKYLDPKAGDSYLDLTAGYGGHAKLVLGRTLQPNQAVLVDRDQQAVDYLSQQFAGQGVKLIQQDFLTSANKLLANGNQFDIILADLGVSSPHLDSASRGFSVRLDGPLDMRMDQSQTRTAEEIVNNDDEAELARIIRRYGEEPRANKIARLIVAHRPIHTTSELANIVTKAWPGRSKHHPAIRTFQALRIAVNDELTLLERALPVWLELLAPGGRIVVISFHSLEDRIVKQFFASHGGDRYDAQLKLLTNRPVTGDQKEIAINPRARSAKLRAAVKK